MNMAPAYARSRLTHAGLAATWTSRTCELFGLCVRSFGSLFAHRYDPGRNRGFEKSVFFLLRLRPKADLASESECRVPLGTGSAPLCNPKRVHI